LPMYSLPVKGHFSGKSSSPKRDGVDIIGFREV
jgi:hypothetical protein